MPKRRALAPQSVWDEGAVAAAFATAGAKPHHVARLYAHLLARPRCRHR
jgi:hypothetical protein